MLNELVSAASVLLFLVSYPCILLYKLLCAILKKNKLKDIAGEVAVVTGAGHGLGRAIALELAHAGCHIAVIDINFEGAEETVSLITNQFPVQAKAYKVDVRNYSDIVALNEKVSNDLGIATILVNNAGMLFFKNVLNPDISDIQRMIDVNLTSHFGINRVFLTKMKELNKGHIVAICSFAGVVPLIQNEVYTASKHGLRSLMKVLRLNLAYENMNINTTTVLPVFLDTNDEVTKIAKLTGYASIFPLLKGPTFAKRIVYGIQKNEKEIFEPSALAVLFRLLQLLPLTIQEKIVFLISKQFHTKYVHYLKELYSDPVQAAIK